MMKLKQVKEETSEEETNNNNEAMKELVRHVIREHGASVINYISGPLSNPEAQARYEAFLHVMAENRLITPARAPGVWEVENCIDMRLAPG